MTFIGAKDISTVLKHCIDCVENDNEVRYAGHCSTRSVSHRHYQKDRWVKEEGVSSVTHSRHLGQRILVVLDCGIRLLVSDKQLMC